MAKKLTQEEVERRIKEMRPEYEFLPFEYKNGTSEIIAVCPKHGNFPTSVSKISSGYGCPKCGIEKAHSKTKKTQKEFLEFVNEKFKDRPLDFSESEYKGAHKDIIFRCELHGYRKLKPYQLLNTQYGCWDCSYVERGLNRRITFEDFIKKALIAHPDKEYDYSKVKIVDYDTPVVIICPKHGAFEQCPDNHIHGAGCPRCKESKGEKSIGRWLNDHSIKFKGQYRIIPKQGVIFGRQYFKVDFYLPDFNTIIEYHGKQHYEKYEIFHKTDMDFQDQQDRDQRLRQYCKENNIKLIEIPYTDIKKIPQILSKKIGRR